jgi:hypothetical protein
MKKALLSLIFLSLLSVGVAHAHQPRIVDDLEVVEIENPTVSQAFYSTLSGESDKFTVTSTSDFLLLTEILTPVIEGKEPGTFTFTVLNLDTNETLLTGTTSKSDEIFYEPFAGDEYRQGPRIEENVQAGNYEFTVKGNSGEKYVVVVGKREIFPFDEIVNTYKSLPSLKIDFFEKPFYTIFTNPTGGGLLIISLITKRE